MNEKIKQRIIKNVSPDIVKQLDFKKQKMMVKEGNKKECWYIWFTCKECKKEQWIRRDGLYRKTTPNCRKCNAIFAREGIIKEIIPDDINKNLQKYFDFSRQERRPVGNNGASTLCIWSTCPKCKEGRWIPHSIAKVKKTPYCLSCKNRHTFRGESKGDGFFVSKGYKIIDITRFYPDKVKYIQENLLPHGGRKSTPIWFREHRVVALLHYGPDAVKKGSVIRHIDGDKLNNNPNNLIPGTHKDNRIDHKEAIMLMNKYKMLSLLLIKIIIAQKSLIEQLKVA